MPPSCSRDPEAREAGRPPGKMVKENMFNVEKHLNDTLHNPQRKGRRLAKIRLSRGGVVERHTDRI